MSLVNLHYIRISKHYENKIAAMDRFQLLDEMVVYQRARTVSRELTPELIAWGKPLFKALLEGAATEELRILANSYLRHLEYESRAYDSSSG